MILPSGVIEFSIINERRLTGDRSSRDKVISFILDNSHSPFLEYNLNRANPITIRNWVDDSIIKMFDYLLIYNL